LTALSNDLRRPAVVRLTVVVFEQTAGAGASERLVPDGIWGRPIYGGVHSRTGRLSWLACRWAIYGAITFTANDYCGRAASFEACRKIVPSTERLIRSVPPSRGTFGAASAAAIAIMRASGRYWAPDPPRVISRIL